MTTETPAGATGEPTDPDGDPQMLASKNPEASATASPGGPVDGAASAVPVQDDPEDEVDPDADPDMLRSGS